MPIDRVQEGDRPGQVRSDLSQAMACPARVKDLLEDFLVGRSQTYGNQRIRLRVTVTANIAPIDERSLQTPCRRFARDRRSGGAAPDDQHIQRFRRQPIDSRALRAG